MHYYQFNIGDYSSHTSRLSDYEDLAYRRLIDLYYLTERPLNGCLTDVARDIGLVERQTEVDYILNKYFVKDGDCWVNDRVDREIKLYKLRKISASKAGKASGKARQTKANERVLNGRSTNLERNRTDLEPTNNQEPITNNQVSKEKDKKKRFAPPSLDEVINYFSDQQCFESANEGNSFFDYYSSNGWKVSRNPMKDWKSTVRNWIRRGKKNGKGQFSRQSKEYKESVPERTARHTKEIFDECEAEEASDRIMESHGTVIQGEVDLV